MGYNPGDISVDTVLITSPLSGSWDARASILTASILETIFTPGVTAEIKVIDTDDWLGQLQLQGTETVYFQITKLTDGSPLYYDFHLNSVRQVEIQGSAKAKTYMLSCISREAISGRIINVQQAYNQPINSIVQDVFSKLNSQNGIATEATKGNRNIKISNQTVYDAIEMLRKEAVSAAFQSSNFMFWQTWSSFHFETLEGMLNAGDVKNFKQDFTIGTSINKSVDDNILAWKVVQNFDAMNRAKAGVVNQRVAVFDPNTLSYKVSNFNDINPIAAMGNWSYDLFRGLFGGENAGRTVLSYRNPNQKLNIPQSFVPAAIPYKQLNLAQMQEQMMHMTTIGDPVLEAGTTIFCDVPKITSATDSYGEKEDQMYGRWLISKVEHEIHTAADLPRYVCNLECLKGAYA
jgi:hypothetical protein